MSVLLSLSPDTDEPPPALLCESRVLPPQQMRQWLQWSDLARATRQRRAEAVEALQAELAALRQDAIAQAEAEASALVEAERERLAAAHAALQLERLADADRLSARLAQQAAEALRACVGELAPGDFEACLLEQLLQHAVGDDRAPVVMVHPQALAAAQRRVGERLPEQAERLRWSAEPGLPAGRVLLRIRDELLELSLDLWLDEWVRAVSPVGHREPTDVLTSDPDDPDDLGAWSDASEADDGSLAQDDAWPADGPEASAAFDLEPWALETAGGGDDTWVQKPPRRPRHR